MIRSARSIVGITLPLLAISVFAVLFVFSLLRLSGIERDMRIEATQNMLWVISQAHVASLRLSETIMQPDLTTDELQLRYNVFLSRYTLLTEGPQRRQMEVLGFAPELDEFARNLPQLEPLIQSGAPDAAAKLRKILSPYNAMLGRAANTAMVNEWNELGSRLDTYRKQLWQIIASLAGISLAGGFLSFRLFVAVRETRQRAQLLQREKAFSELLIGSSGEGILAVDLNGRCTVWNEAMERLFNLSPDKAAGQILGDISGFFEVERVRQALAQALGGGAATLLDQPFFKPEHDTPLYIDLRCFALCDGPQIIGSIMLVSDVTERHAAQREIASHRDHLEELVRARTKELDEALERERATADLYRNFAAMVSHQFRTPLAIVDSALQRLLRRGDKVTPDELTERTTRARQAIARLIKLVETTLDAARLDAGQIIVHSQPCDIGRLVETLCERQREATPDRDIILTIANEEPMIACCDPTHAEHVLVNLVSNAVKYSPSSTPINIKISTSGNDVDCTVSNQGQFIAAADQDRLFDRYFRGENAEGLPGIGIGLYMAQTLARMQGGDLSFVSAPKSQTAFCLTLPLFAPKPVAVAYDPSDKKALT